jgi:hypothetical protein
MDNLRTSQTGEQEEDVLWRLREGFHVLLETGEEGRYRHIMEEVFTV